jgi:hypothetical protein
VIACETSDAKETRKPEPLRGELGLFFAAHKEHENFASARTPSPPNFKHHARVESPTCDAFIAIIHKLEGIIHPFLSNTLE